MQYLTSLYGDEAEDPEPGTPEWDAEMPGYVRFGELAGERIVAGEALNPSSTAITVRHDPVDDASSPLVTNGPFTETTECIGGFYVLEADSLDEAIELAREIPIAQKASGGVEVRPVVMLWTPETPVTAQEGDTRYLATIYGKESAADIPNTPEWDQGAAEHGRFIEKHAGSLISGVAVHPVATSTTVRVRDGELLVTDGPFTEAAEVVGGLYMLRAASRDEAVAVAQDIPTNPGGAIELRPVMEFD